MSRSGGILLYPQGGKFVLEHSYMLQGDKEDERYNAEVEISLRAFLHIEMTPDDIFEGVFQA